MQPQSPQGLGTGLSDQFQGMTLSLDQCVHRQRDC